MQTRNILCTLWMTIAVLCLAACTTPAPAPVQTVDMTNPRAKLIIGSNELLGAVELSNPIFRNVGQLQQTQIQLDNLSNVMLELEYKIDWQDNSGFQAGAVNSWQFVSLTANGSEVLSSTGKVPEATRITVTVRLPDKLFEVIDDEVEPEPEQY